MSDECSRYQMDSSAFLDGELDAEAARSLFLHLADCKTCRTFWGALIRAERELIREERIGGSPSLDARVASIGGHRAGLRNRSGRASIGLSRERGSAGQERVSFPYSFAAIASLLAVSLGFILGTAPLWMGSTTNQGEPRIEYVSVLPGLTVVGHPAEQGVKVH